MLLSLSIFAGAVYLLFRISSEVPQGDVDADRPPIPKEEVLLEEVERKSVKIYLPLRDLSGVEAFSVDLKDQTRSLAEWVSELILTISQPISPNASPVFPEDIRPKGVFLGKRGILYLDLPGQGLSSSLAGVELERLCLIALLRTIGENVPGVKAVKILVDGKDRETLWGHVDLRAPLPVSFR